MAGSVVIDPDELWVFGYGSLIFRPDFPFVCRREGFIRGWTRRLWQASLDHRGTPELPGRVATLVASPEDCCWGVAYRVANETRAQVLHYLDARESGGYERRQLAFFGAEGEQLASALVYVADEDNPNFVGPEDTSVTAARIHAAIGLTGCNREYVLRLSAALAEIGAEDPHVLELVQALARAGAA